MLKFILGDGTGQVHVGLWKEEAVSALFCEALSSKYIMFMLHIIKIEYLLFR